MGRGSRATGTLEAMAAGRPIVGRRGGAIPDYTYLWWDVRPHPRLGTIEIRVMDVQFDLFKSNVEDWLRVFQISAEKAREAADRMRHR